MKVSGKHEERAKSLRRAVIGIVRCDIPEGRDTEEFSEAAAKKLCEAIVACVSSIVVSKEWELAGEDVRYVVTIRTGCGGVEWSIARTRA